MGHPEESLVFENDKLIIVRDKWHWIIRKKPIDKQHPYKEATYLTDGNNLLWEICDCRKLCEVGSPMAMAILSAYKGAKGLKTCSSTI